LLRNYYTPTCAAVRDYCNAYHARPVKDEIIAALIRHGSAAPRNLHKLSLAGTPVRTGGHTARMLDMQDWFSSRTVYARAKFPAERLIDRQLMRTLRYKAWPSRFRQQDPSFEGWPLNGRDA